VLTLAAIAQKEAISTDWHNEALKIGILPSDLLWRICADECFGSFIASPLEPTYL
jgi:hypothetical protein